MNKKQKVLTVCALIAFVVIGWFLFFFLGVIYAGLFFLLSDKKNKQ